MGGKVTDGVAPRTEREPTLLDTERPERLLTDLTHSTLLQEIEKLGEWGDRNVRATDYILLNWSADHLNKSTLAIAEFCSTIMAIIEDECPPEPYATRWRAFYDLLEVHRRDLAAEHYASTPSESIESKARRANVVHQGKLGSMG